MISVEEYNKNMAICGLTTKIIKESKGSLDDSEVKELVEIIDREAGISHNFDVVICGDCNKFNEQCKFDWFEYGCSYGWIKKGFHTNKITHLQSYDDDGYVDGEIDIIFSYTPGEGFDRDDYKGIEIGKNPKFIPDVKNITLFEYRHDGIIEYVIEIYNPTVKSQKWQYTPMQMSILEMLEREM